MNKHSSLLGPFVNYEGNSVANTALGACTMKRLLYLMYRNKLERLPLPPSFNIFRQGKEPTIRGESCKRLLSGCLLPLLQILHLD